MPEGQPDRVDLALPLQFGGPLVDREHGMTKYARISEDGLYRYSLGRRWSGAGPVAQFIMLNPSTADAVEDDRTIRRCMGFARGWGLAGIQVLNLYAYRATKPADLWLAADPVGPLNDAYLRTAGERDDTPIIAAWGANARLDRVTHVLRMLAGKRIECLEVTKSGAPGHPLYLPSNSQRMLFRDCTQGADHA